MLIDLCTLAIPAFSVSPSVLFLALDSPSPFYPKKKVRPEKDLDFFSICLARFFATRLGEIVGSWKQLSPPKKKLQ